MNESILVNRPRPFDIQLHQSIAFIHLAHTTRKKILYQEDLISSFEYP